MINKIGHISDSRNKQLKNHRHVVDSAKNSLQYRVARDIKEQSSSVNYNFNKDDFNKGIEWFNSGLPLEDATEELRNNASFVAGFNKGKRIHLVNEQLYNLGREYFERGEILQNIPENYKNNEHFLRGYNDTLNGRKR